MPFEPATRTVPIDPTGFASTVAPDVAAEAPVDAAADVSADAGAATDAAGACVGAVVAAEPLVQAPISRMSGMTAAPRNRCRPMSGGSPLEGLGFTPTRTTPPRRRVS